MKKASIFIAAVLVAGLSVQEANACWFSCWRFCRPCCQTRQCSPCGAVQTTTPCGKACDAPLCDAPSCDGGSCLTDEFTPGIDDGYTEEVERMIASVNAVRLRRGLCALRFDRFLCAGAVNTARYDARNFRLQHVMRRGDVGEIIACNGRGFDAAVTQWVFSDAHRAHLLCRSYRRVGVAMVKRGGRCYCCVKFGY